eukprot:scaffold156446_cov22-Tisochrysis_lutea.AAC.1
MGQKCCITLRLRAGGHFAWAYGMCDYYGFDVWLDAVLIEASYFKFILMRAHAMHPIHALVQEFAEYDKQGALLRRARNPINFESSADDDEGAGTSYEDDDDDDLDFSGGGGWISSLCGAQKGCIAAMEVVVALAAACMM